MKDDQVKIQSGEKVIETTVETMEKAAKMLSGETRVKEIAEEILGIQADKKRLNEAINDLLEEAENFGIPKKAMRLAIEMWENEKRSQFNRGYFRACEAIGISVQLEMDF